MRWEKYQGYMLLQADAPHVAFAPSHEEVAKALKAHGALVARWTEDWDCSAETDFWYVIKDRFGGIEELSQRTRNKMRHALKSCVVERKDLEWMCTEGYGIHRAAVTGYGLSPPTQGQFAANLRALHSENREYWGVKHESGAIIAYAIVQITDESALLSAFKFDPAHGKANPTYPLIHEIVRHYLTERKLKYVSDGARSLSHETQVQEFLIGILRFRKAHCRLRVQYAPLAGLAVKILYPFRKAFAALPFSALRPVTALMLQEEIARRCA